MQKGKRIRRAVLLTLLCCILLLAACVVYGRHYLVQSRLDRRFLNAVQRGEVGVTIQALQEGANPNARWTDDRPAYDWRDRVAWVLHRPSMWQSKPALMIAARDRNFPLLKALLDQGADINARDEYDNTVLKWAVEVGDSAMVYYLLARGAAVNLRNEYGDTALMRACANGNVECVRFLLAKGAKATFHNKDKETALILATNAGCPQAVTLLKQAGAKE